MSFPASPNIGDIATAGNRSFVWDGTIWDSRVSQPMITENFPAGNTGAFTVVKGFNPLGQYRICVTAFVNAGKFHQVVLRVYPGETTGKPEVQHSDGRGNYWPITAFTLGTNNNERWLIMTLDSPDSNNRVFVQITQEGSDQVYQPEKLGFGGIAPGLTQRDVIIIYKRSVFSTRTPKGLFNEFSFNFYWNTNPISKNQTVANVPGGRQFLIRNRVRCDNNFNWGDYNQMELYQRIARGAGQGAASYKWSNMWSDSWPTTTNFEMIDTNWIMSAGNTADWTFENTLNMRQSGSNSSVRVWFEVTMIDLGEV